MEIKSILELIIKPELLKSYLDWEDFANEKEKKGLKLIGAIYKHKGLKKFRADPPSKQLNSFNITNVIDVKKAEEIYRKSQITSSYSSEFGRIAKEKPQGNIFKYLKVSETELKECLTKLAVQFLDNWVDCKDEAEFQELVLVALRSLHARFKSIQISKTETKQQYQWNVDWKLCKPIRIDKIGSNLKTSKTDYNAMINKQLKQEELDRELEETGKVGGDD